MRQLRIAAVLASFAFLLVVAPASAMTVTSTGETGACTLRGAITAVNAHDSSTPCGPVAGSGATTINVPANTYTITGQLSIASGANVAIVGANPNFPQQTVIDAGGGSRVFEVLAGGALTLSGVEVTNGQTANGTDAAAVGQGGGPGVDGGGILNHGSVTLDHALVTANFTGHGGRGANGGGGADTNGRGGGYGGSGGGIYNDVGAQLTVTASTISNNGTGGGGAGGDGSPGKVGSGFSLDGGVGGNGGYPGSGGGIANNQGSVTITNSTVSGNFTGDGGPGGSGGQGATETPTNSAGRGGRGGDGGSASFTRDIFDNQYKLNNPLGGGGIANYGGGSLTITASTINGNHTGDGGTGGNPGVGGKKLDNTFDCCSLAGYGGSGGLGGGVFSFQSTTTLVNVTLSGNYTGDGGTGGSGTISGTGAPGPGGHSGWGGAIWGTGAFSPWLVQLTHATIAGNAVGAAGSRGAGTGTPLVDGARGRGAGVATGGRHDPSGPGVLVRNSIIADNGNPGLGDSNCAETGASPTNYFDAGHNLTWNDTSCPGSVQDPLLGPLADNGGPTKTRVPGSGSPAIGGVPSASCTTNTDQRGFPRPGTAGANCDIGAVETGSAPAQTSTTTSLSSSANPSLSGQTVTYTATVSPIPSGGNVSFKDGGTPISGCSSVAVSGGGQAVCPVPYASPGSHSIVAGYLGSGSFSPSTSATLTQIVQSPPPSTHTVTVTKIGTGTVSSQPAGISCGSVCSAPFAHGTPVTLNASPGPGFTFTGWSGGGCSGTGACHLTVSSNAAVTARFSPVPDNAACDDAKARVRADQSKVDAAAKKLAKAKDKGSSKAKIKRLKRALKRAKGKLAADEAAQAAACG